MRDKFGIAISVIIALSLLYFIAPMDDLMTLFGRPHNVGEINGTGISYEEFQSEVNTFTTINEIATGSSTQNEETQKQIRNAAWQSLLDRFLFFRKCEEAGIKVCDAEVADLVMGNHISHVVYQNPYFADENGEFSVAKVIEFDQAAGDNEQVKVYWNYLKQSLKTQQFYNKYGSLFAMSSIDTPLSLRNAVAEGNTTVDLDVVTIPYGFQKDSSINVSASEIKAYYNNHKEDYKQVASRDIEYVVFEVKPSASDFAATEDEMNKARAEFANADNMKTFLLKNSDRPYSEYWYKKGELKTVNNSIDEFVFSGKGGISPVYQEGNTYYAARVMATAQRPDSVYVKHILLQGADEAKADSLLAVVRKAPKTFAFVASQFSSDKGSAYDGELGNIGWMTQNYMIPGFESVLTAEINKPYVIKTQYGTHVVVVTKATKPQLKKQVAILQKDVLASKETFGKYYAEANTFSTIANGTVEGYLKAVDSLGVYSHKQPNLLESTSSFAGVDQAKEITRWAFDAKKGKASNIITVNNNYFFVVALKDVRKDGYKPVREVASSIQSKLYTKKYNAKKVAEVKEKIAGCNTLEEVAAAYKTTVANRTDISFSPMGAGAVEPALLGAVYGAETGVVSGPVAGAGSVYVFKVTKHEEGNFYTEADAKMYTSQKAQYASQMVIPVMQEAAKVEDNRERYF